jgi:hypothetical protein
VRPKHFLRRAISTGEIAEIPFNEAHFKAVGLPPSTLAGMPQLEAYQLINQWNVSQPEQQFVFALAA